MLEYRYNKYFSELKIDRSIDFGTIKKRSVETSTDITDKISIYGVLNADTMKFTKVDLTGFGLTTHKELDDYREVALAFFRVIADEDIIGLL